MWAEEPAPLPDPTPRALAAEVDAKAQGPGVFEVEGAGIRAKVTVVDADRLGVTIDRIHLEGEPGSLAERARAMAEGVRPGGEALHPVEVDPGLGGGVLRSRMGANGDRGYLQLDLDTKSAELSGHQVGSDGSRSPATITLTRPQLGRVIEGMARGLQAENDDD